ncbi:MAG TPA: hypothetical protein VNV43_11620 [Candidatus Acidoferrales bacterium]|nr:hypothetical protein [Candidatus Acidoferrales bacterium]
MSFRLADVQALLLVCLVFSLFPAAKAQSTGGGQRILFSSPDGQVTSNAPLPMAQAPEPQETPNMPGGEAASPQFSVPASPMILFPPPALQQNNAQKRNDFQDPTDFRKQMGLLTPAQIMDVPTPEQIFGLAEKPAESQKKPAQSQNLNAATNNLASDATAIIGEPTWATARTGNTEKGVQTSNTTEKASGLFDRFFDTARSDDVLGSHSSGNADTLFGQSQTQSQSAGQQSPWGSQLTSDEITPSAPATEPIRNSFTMPGSPRSDWTSQSPFTPPPADTLGTLPKLPVLPSFSRQNDRFSQPAATTSWGPKPPPWTQAQTPWGTPVPLNQTLNR